ncbi:class I SAM-dependent methyltransferase [Chlorobium limicola]|nr:hypothetical protein [Chlorobium limicola]
MTVLQDTFEANRLRLQSELDAGKTQAERNRLGQFATPTALALDILTYASSLIPEDEPVRFLDPAVGTGSFFSAFRQVFPAGRIDSVLGFEVDTHYGEPATQEQRWDALYYLYARKWGAAFASSVYGERLDVKPMRREPSL